MTIIATEYDAAVIGGGGSYTSNLMATRTRAAALGCGISGSYADNQLVRKSALYKLNSCGCNSVCTCYSACSCYYNCACTDVCACESACTCETETTYKVTCTCYEGFCSCDNEWAVEDCWGHRCMTFSHNFQNTSTCERYCNPQYHDCNIWCPYNTCDFNMCRPFSGDYDCSRENECQSYCESYCPNTCSCTSVCGGHCYNCSCTSTCSCTAQNCTCTSGHCSCETNSAWYDNWEVQ